MLGGHPGRLGGPRAADADLQVDADGLADVLDGVGVPLAVDGLADRDDVVAHDSLSFFVGGDNVIAACPDLARDDYRAAIDHVADDVDVQLKVGVGTGASPHDAGYAAKHALEDCRYEGTLVEFA